MFFVKKVKVNDLSTMPMALHGGLDQGWVGNIVREWRG